MYDLSITLLPGSAIWAHPRQVCTVFCTVFSIFKGGSPFLTTSQILLPLISYLHASSFEIFCFYKYLLFSSLLWVAICNFRFAFYFQFPSSCVAFGNYLHCPNISNKPTPNPTITIRRKVITNEKSNLE